MPVTLTSFSSVTKNKQGKVDESVDSLNDIGDFGTYCEGDFERIFSCSTYVGFYSLEKRVVEGIGSI